MGGVEGVVGMTGMVGMMGVVVSTSGEGMWVRVLLMIMHIVWST